MRKEGENNEEEEEEEEEEKEEENEEEKGGKEGGGLLASTRAWLGQLEYEKSKENHKFKIEPGRS